MSRVHELEEDFNKYIKETFGDWSYEKNPEFLWNYVFIYFIVSKGGKNEG